MSYLSFLFLFLIPVHLSVKFNHSLLSIWDVGQGQWISLIQNSSCYHMDMGGEKFPKEVISHCKNKKNLVFLTHTDMDHINLIPQAKKRFFHLCLVYPVLEKLSEKKKKILNELSFCTEKQNLIKSINPSLRKVQKNKANELMRVFILKEIFLNPGDSLFSWEKEWILKIKNKEKIKWMILSHHGSYLSNKKETLKKLSFLKQAFVSARKSKYGHPHEKSLKRFKDLKIPVLSTEKWGNIHLILYL